MNTNGQWQAVNDPQPDSIVLENGFLKVCYRNNNSSTTAAFPSRTLLRKDSCNGSSCMQPSKSSKKKTGKPRHLKKPPPTTTLAQATDDIGQNNNGTITALSCDRRHQNEIEIAPGFWARLRGAHETLSCLRDGNYQHTACLACRTQLCCVAGATYVICPQCRVVSPVDEFIDQTASGGVGLGVAVEDMSSWNWD